MDINSMETKLIARNVTLMFPKKEPNIQKLLVFRSRTDGIMYPLPQIVRIEHDTGDDTYTLNWDSAVAQLRRSDYEKYIAPYIEVTNK